MNSNVLDTSDQTINLSLAKPKQELQCGSRQVQWVNSALSLMEVRQAVTIKNLIALS